MIELIVGIAVFLILYFIVIREKAELGLYIPQVYTDLSSIEIEFIRLVNQHRISLGLNPLLVEELSSKICEDMVDYCLDLDKDVTHDGFQARSKETKSLLCGEVCGQGYKTAKGFFDAYLKSSKGHAKILEGEQYNWIGVSIKNGKNYCLLTTY